MPAYQARVQIAKPTVFAGIQEAMLQAMRATLHDMEEVAQQKVPVRQLFKGGRRKLRFATEAETSKANEIMSARGLGDNFFRSAPPGLKATPTNAVGKRFYRVVDDTNPLTRRIAVRSTNADGTAGISYREVANKRPRSGANQANLYAPRLKVRSGPYAGKFIRSVRLRDYANQNPDTPGPGVLRSRVAQSNLTARGARLVASRAAQKKYRTDGLLVYGDTAGGTLKHSIVIDEPEVTLGTVMGVQIGLRMRGGLSAGNAEAYYAKYQELGTRKMPAHPFLRPALHSVREIYRTNMKMALLKSLKRNKHRSTAAPARTEAVDPDLQESYKEFLRKFEDR